MKGATIALIMTATSCVTVVGMVACFVGGMFAGGALMEDWNDKNKKDPKPISYGYSSAKETK